MSRFTRRDRVQIAVLLACMAPFVATTFLGVAEGNAQVIVISTGLAIASAGFSLAWGTETLQFLVSQALALAILALVSVLPEYSIEVVLAYNGATNSTLLDYATAAMTGANRLLLGVGWPAVFVLSAYASGKAGRPSKELVLEGLQSVEILFLGLATLYTFVIALKGTLGPLDAVVLIVIFGGYVYIAKKLPSHGQERMGELEGPAKAVAGMKGPRRYLAMAFFVGLGGAAIGFGSEPFVKNFLALAASLNLSSGYQYLLIQWLTPLLTELPEAVTVIYWATKIGKGPLALASLVSSKLNQWTLLLSTIPLAYSVALGGFYSIALTHLQSSEILLTACLSLYGFVCLLDLRVSRVEVGLLFGLFMVQFLLPGVRLEVSVAYLLLAALELGRTRGRLDAVRNFASSFREHVR